MEIALENAMPSYSGGLGVLAATDSRRRDLRLPCGRLAALPQRIFHAASLRRRLADRRAVEWRAEDFLTEEPARASVPLKTAR